MAYIYTISCPINNTVIYVGSTFGEIETRIREHINSKNNGNSSFRKYLRSLKCSPIIEVIETVDTLSEQELYAAEQYWIEQIRQWGFRLYNSTWNLSKEKFDGEEVDLPTVSVRINSVLLNKIREICKHKKMTIAGYIELTICKKLNI